MVRSPARLAVLAVAIAVIAVSLAVGRSWVQATDSAADGRRSSTSGHFDVHLGATTTAGTAAGSHDLGPMNFQAKN